MFRIKSTNASLSNSSSPAVLLQHGLFSNADTWIVHYPKSAPAFVLANAGYDVWLGNNRGNNYNQKHLLYDPLNRK
jgi:lysosomal acid lipase/cholesteryl ester hydrolase